MPFEIHPIGPSREGKTWSAIRHCDSEFRAWVSFPADSGTVQQGTWDAILSWDSVLESTVLAGFSDDNSYIGQCDAEVEEYVIRGRISNLVEDARGSLVDVYLLNGPEFVLFERSELGSKELTVGDGIQVKTKGLCLECANAV